MSNDVEMVRFKLDMPPNQAAAFDIMMESCGLEERKDLFNAAMTLFDWAVREVDRGRKIASYDEEADSVEVILLPALENTRKT